MEEPSNHGSGKRSFFGLGKKKKNQDKAKPNPDSPPTTEAASPELEPMSDIDDTPNTTIPISAKAPQLPQLTAFSPIATTAPNVFSSFPSPPTTSPIQSVGSSSSPPPVPRPGTSEFASPRLSTSSSQIFERNVQEQLSSTNLPPPTSSAIPAHIQTENRIPAVLEASSIAITDEKCGVDEVEIVMHSMHQPAVSVPHRGTSSSPVYGGHVPGYGSDNAIDESSGNSGDELSSHGTGIGAAAAADKRRLSFISFADVVQAEQAEHEGVMASSGSLRNLSPGGSPNVVPADRDVALSTINETLRRSPSPIRLGSSPPRGSGNVQRTLSGKSMGTAGAGSPPRTSMGDSLGMERGELTIETMRQALRKTGSGDLSGYGGARSNPSLR